MSQALFTRGETVTATSLSTLSPTGPAPGVRPPFVVSRGSLQAGSCLQCLHAPVCAHGCGKYRFSHAASGREKLEGVEVGAGSLLAIMTRLHTGLGGKYY